jgi:2-hydroxychromene-2-carboxylate isomerase
VERAAQVAGARRKPRRHAPVDPALAARARAALERLTGRPGRVAANRLEVAFVDETDLAELVEGLETAAARMLAAGD